MSVFARPTLRPVTVCGRELPHATHICALFDSSTQELDVLVPYFSQGLEQGEQVITIRDQATLAQHQNDLEERMPDRLDDAIGANQFRVLASEETYLKDGFFGAERMASMLGELLEEASASPFRRVRTCGDMTWALRDMPGTDELMQYESRVNVFTREHDCTLMCVYDVNQFSGRAVMDVLATHPMVVMGEQIYENPYYIEPEMFLQTLLRRGSAPLKRGEPAPF